VVERVLDLWRARVDGSPPPAADGGAAVAAVTGADDAGERRRAGTAPVSERLDRAWNAGEPTRAARMLYAVARVVLVGFCHLWFRVEVSGKEHVPASGAVILAPVHRSNLDTPIVAAVSRRPLRFMGKDGLWRAHPAFSWLITALGAFPVMRGTVDREALRRCQTVLEAGQPLVLYPEGTRQHGPVLHELFDGPAFLALRTGAPIVPIGIGGSERAQAKGSKWIRPTKVRVVVGPPIHPPAAAGRSTSRRAVRELSATLQHDLQVLFDQAQAGLPV
jgi:1-acyl-sn-glycerol-3-phosphate acyltransferase